MARKKGGKKVPSKKSPYKRPPPIPKGEVITDNFSNKTWTLGETVGVGGFGDIYSACPNEGPEKGLYNYVVKVEPQENGPLFVEKHFYIRNAKESDIKEYMKANNLKSFGMPTFFGHGFHEFNGEKYRYLILQRYGPSVWDHFEKCNRSFSPDTVFLLGLQMLKVLNYIHGRGYIHADIKGGNILLGRNKGTEHQAYLVDYGLATRLTNKEYAENPKSAHDGTLEYVSRDGHKGAHTMRGDLEILAYNMLQWLIGTLPWEKPSQQANTVMNMKLSFMSDVRKSMKDYPMVPDQLTQFFEYINTLEPMDTPDYEECEKILLDFLKNKKGKLVFKPYNNKNTKNDGGGDDRERNITDDVKVKKRGRKPKTKPETENTKVVEDGESKKVKSMGKRKSNEFQPIVRMKRMKLTEAVTPPAKENHTNIATQTSAGSCRNARFVTFDSPVSEVIEDSTHDDTGLDNSLTETKGSRKGRKLLSSKEVIVTRTVKRKVTTTKKKDKSWKDAPTIVNGKPPKN